MEAEACALSQPDLTVTAGSGSPGEPGDAPHCQKCGCSMDWSDCANCGGEGETELYELDPLWYDEDDVEDCDWCQGSGGYWACFTCNPGGAFDD
jgi:hypothetical protein